PCFVGQRVKDPSSGAEVVVDAEARDACLGSDGANGWVLQSGRLAHELARCPEDGGPGACSVSCSAGTPIWSRGHSNQFNRLSVKQPGTDSRCTVGLVPAKPPRQERVRVVQDRWLAYGTVPLRFFLGITFVYAGLQKIADPGFLSPGSTTYIGTQLQAFAVHSPIDFLIDSLALPAPALTGLGVIGAELAIGVGVLLRIATRLAAIGGAVINFVFLLTASWTV